MKSGDAYVDKLEQIVAQIEELYGLCEKSEVGLEYWKVDVQDVIAFVSKRVSGMSKDELKQVNSQVGRKVVMLSYLKDRMTYFGKKKLDFSEMPCMATIAKILITFTARGTIVPDSLQSLNKVILILSKIDVKNVKYRYSLAYRYLRIFIVMALHGNYCNASVIASIILEQIIVKE